MPDISVVLLTRNGGADLAALLDALERQQPAQNLEIVAVDSGSTDGTLDCLEAHGARVHPIPPEEFQFGRTRDLAFSLATAPLIVTVSQDAVPANQDWLAELLAPLAGAGVGAACSKTLPWPEPRPVFFWERHGGYDFTRTCRRWYVRFGFGFTNVSAAFRRETWEAVRFGDVEMSEDKVFQKRLHAQRGQAVYASQSTVWHGHTYSVGELRKRVMNEGLGWRTVGEGYSLRDMLADAAIIFRRGSQLQREFDWGRRTGGIRTAAENGFPILRPWFEFLGVHFAKGYQR